MGLTFFKDKYTVDIPGPNDYEVSGDFCRDGHINIWVLINNWLWGRSGHNDDFSSWLFHNNFFGHEFLFARWAVSGWEDEVLVSDLRFSDSELWHLDSVSWGHDDVRNEDNVVIDHLLVLGDELFVAHLELFWLSDFGHQSHWWHVGGWHHERSDFAESDISNAGSGNVDGSESWELDVFNLRVSDVVGDIGDLDIGQSVGGLVVKVDHLKLGLSDFFDVGESEVIKSVAHVTESGQRNIEGGHVVLLVWDTEVRESTLVDNVHIEVTEALVNAWGSHGSDGWVSGGDGEIVHSSVHIRETNAWDGFFFREHDRRSHPKHCSP